MNAVAKFFREHKGEKTMSSLAASLGVPVTNVSQWVSSEKPIPPKHAAGIEEFTEGAVRIEDVCQGFPWKTVKKVLAKRLEGV